MCTCFTKSKNGKRGVFLTFLWSVALRLCKKIPITVNLTSCLLKIMATSARKVALRLQLGQFTALTQQTHADAQTDTCHTGCSGFLCLLLFSHSVILVYASNNHTKLIRVQIRTYWETSRSWKVALNGRTKTLATIVDFCCCCCKLHSVSKKKKNVMVVGETENTSISSLVHSQS